MKVPSTRFERVTPGLGILCSIHLSYEGVLEFQLVSVPRSLPESPTATKLLPPLSRTVIDTPRLRG